VRAGQAEVDRLGGAGAQRTHLHTRRDVQPVVRVAGRAVTILIQANILTSVQVTFYRKELEKQLIFLGIV
jgi:hypothetical protein